ncbi:MAG: hypothetical protein PHQ00_00065 [Phycisphaerae bacterium]|nr:hypothetical protein [Phycisphaerae bacterium]
MTSQEKHNYELVRGYQCAGSDFLAYKLKRLFMIIETPEDIALHNDILGDVLVMIEPDPATFMKAFADMLIERESIPKGFLRKIADKILEISLKRKAN